MQRRQHRLIGFGFLCVALFISGCSEKKPFKPLITAAVDRTAHTEIFSVGYRGISEKYIEPVSVADIALGGLQGFSSIDPALQVTRDGELIHLRMSGKSIHSTSIRPANDSAGWANVTTQFEQYAKSHSRLMNEASDEKIFEAVFDGILSDLDVFSRYAGAEEARRNRARRDGFGGIGIRFKLKNGKPVVTKVIPETPAATAGLKMDDEITHIDGHVLLNSKVQEIVRKLRGPTLSEVRLRVYRAAIDRNIDVVMERMHIVPTTVKASVQNGIATLKISSFNQATSRSVAKELRRAKRFTDSGLTGLILDLRGNPGGLLKQSVKVVDLLLTHGQILSTRGRHPDSLHHYEAGGRDMSGGIPIAILVDGKSASASEIVAAALQDRGRAAIIGTSSFGKGTVQTVIRLPNDGEVTLTWSRFITPSGYALHGLGVRPAICTSGQSSGSGRSIRSEIREAQKTRAVFASWRSAAFEAKDKRKSLRSTCISERRTGDSDLKVARILLSDPALYTQTLEITGTPSQAQK